MMHLQGRVFTRLHHFQALPSGLQHEANALADYLTQHQMEVFEKHHTLKLKSVYSVRSKHLLHTIDNWITTQHAGHVTGTAMPHAAHGSHVPGTHGPPHAGHVPAASAGGLGPTAIPVASAGGHTSHSKEHLERRASHIASSHAKTLLDALVLKGFLAPQKEDKRLAPSTTEDLTFKDSELLVPLSKLIKSETIATTSVWDLVDGAVFAGSLKRKTAMLGKDVYAVVNARCKTLTLFKTDVGRKPIVQLDASTMKVAFDSAHTHDHAVKVWTASDKEVLHTGSQQESDALVHALLAVGATHEKRHFLDDHMTPSEMHNPIPGAGHHHQHHQHDQVHHQQHGAHAPVEKNASLGHKIGNLFKSDDAKHHHGDGHVKHHGVHSSHPPGYAAP